MKVDALAVFQRGHLLYSALQVVQYLDGGYGKFAHAFCMLQNEENMEARLEGTTKHNPELIDLIFKLMFETIWLPPHDLRRTAQSFVAFERDAKQLVGALYAADIAELVPERLETMRHTAQVLEVDVEEMFMKKIIPASVRRKATEQLRGIQERLEAASAAAELR